MLGAAIRGHIAGSTRRRRASEFGPDFQGKVYWLAQRAHSAWGGPFDSLAVLAADGTVRATRLVCGRAPDSRRALWSDASHDFTAEAVRTSRSPRRALRRRNAFLCKLHGALSVGSALRSKWGAAAAARRARRRVDLLACARCVRDLTLGHGGAEVRGRRRRRKATSWLRDADCGIRRAALVRVRTARSAWLAVGQPSSHGAQRSRTRRGLRSDSRAGRRRGDGTRSELPCSVHTGRRARSAAIAAVERDRPGVHRQILFA